ncbi:MAG TPA: aspartyl/asparaginyl beta-hydroxylase domain-containing protein [Chitinophagales bacterium]|nr:aspartyl/asparaginyl beta-hydroxylase domain-containing protein [Chitinophagales bacterium]
MNAISWPENEKLLVHIRESKYDGSLPCFYPAHLFPEVEPLKKNWKAIRDEVLTYERQHGLIKGLNTYSPPELSSEVSWSNIYLENFTWRFHKNRKYFPVTCAALDKIPNCTLAAISVLSPHSTIMPHYGDTNGIIRCHLGLVIPDKHPVCGIRVGKEEMGWAEGETLFFTEAHQHTTWNNSDKRRYVLVVDIIPQGLAERKSELCSKVLGAQTFVYFEKRFPFLKNISGSALKATHLLLSALWRMYLPVQRRLKFL